MVIQICNCVIIAVLFYMFSVFIFIYSSVHFISLFYKILSILICKICTDTTFLKL
jgi:hypothetical protein